MKLLYDFAIALVHPRRYRELLDNSVGRVFLYVILIMLISAIPLISSTRILILNLSRYYENNIPEFVFENQTLKAEDDFELKLVGTKFIINTSRQFTKDDFGNAYNGLIFDGDSLLIKQGSKVQDVLYSELTDGKDVTLTKESMYNYSAAAERIIRLMVMIGWLFSIPMFLLSTLIVAAGGRFLLSILPFEGELLPFGKIYKLALYARSFPIAITVILSVFFKVPSILGIILAILILVRGGANAMLSIKLQEETNMEE